jgi:hypothetical protein
MPAPATITSGMGSIQSMPERFHIHSEEVEPGVFELSLEQQAGARHLLRGTEWRTIAVLARRRYLANDMFGMASYRAALEQAAQHATTGHYGCYVETRRLRGGKVEVELIERVVVESKLRTEILASRTFDASDEGALVASSEFAAELSDWAERVNTERETVLAEGAVERDAALADAAERERAAAELEEILRRTSGP